MVFYFSLMVFGFLEPAWLNGKWSCTTKKGRKIVKENFVKR